MTFRRDDQHMIRDWTGGLYDHPDAYICGTPMCRGVLDHVKECVTPPQCQRCYSRHCSAVLISMQKASCNADTINQHISDCQERRKARGL